MIKLSVLIATMPARILSLTSLIIEIDGQSMGDDSFEILVDDSMEYNVGAKRNKLLERASGEYVVFIDDDDRVSPDYISKILQAIESGPDCVGISGTIFIFNEVRQWHISKEYGNWYDRNKVYYRTPNHISPVKRSIALQAMFPEVSFAEDSEYSARIYPLLETEVIIPGNIYFYTPSKK